MEEHDSPYEYGGELPGTDLGDGVGPDGETVIVDGAAMSYRSYRRRERNSSPDFHQEP